jgi:lactate dehydrogenase-like 2-hydroxyacid dehydrogenase
VLVTDGGERAYRRHLNECPDARAFDLMIPETDAPELLYQAAPRADAILTYQVDVPAALIQAAARLRLIQKHGLNCRNIDVAAAASRNVVVATLPLMRNVTVAEHALALMLACARRIVAAHEAVRAARYQDLGLEPMATSQHQYRSNWARLEGLSELFRAAVGIVGMGDIGMEIAKRCRAFEMTVSYTQRRAHPAATEAALGIRYSPLAELLTASDFVVLALPHSPQTDRLIGARELALMKPSATLINVGRGGLIDEDALIEALRAKRIAKAGLDVYRYEPLPVSSALRSLENVVLQPHTGGGSYRSWEIDMPAVFANIRRFFDGRGADGIVST